MFLRKHTSLSVNDRELVLRHSSGRWRRGNRRFRADMDAIKGAGNIPLSWLRPRRPQCYSGRALPLTEGRVFQKNLCFLFQPAEETGEGGKICCNLLEELGADRVYGFHNLPGYPLGTAVMRRETFSCASRGLIIRLTGKPCHAAYPEQGINPAYLISG